MGLLKRLLTGLIWGEPPVPDDPKTAREQFAEEHLRYMNAIEQEIFGDVDPDRQRDIVETILEDMRDMARAGFDEGPSEGDLEIHAYGKFLQYLKGYDEPPSEGETVETLHPAKVQAEEVEHVPPAYVREYIRQVMACYVDAFTYIPHDSRAVEYTQAPWFNAVEGETPILSAPGEAEEVLQQHRKQFSTDP
jgi:hypothetical protein